MNIPEKSSTDSNKLYQEAVNLLDNGDINCIENKCINNNNIYNELNKIAIYDKILYNNRKELIDKLGTKYNCKNNTLLCVLYKINDKINDKSNEFSNYGIDSSIINNSIIKAKQPGPFDSNRWFSDGNIDDVLKKFEILFKKKNFFHIYFHMRDFKINNKYEDEKRNINKINFCEKYKDGYRCFGVVFNTDISSGSGEHWFCLFCNFYDHPFTIEYFNSSGESPCIEISELMCKIKHQMSQFFIDNAYKNTDVDDIGVVDEDTAIKCPVNYIDKYVRCIQATKLINQRDNSSCGAYSIFYILARLYGIPYEFFKNNIIGDNLMYDLRHKLFAHNY